MEAMLMGCRLYYRWQRREEAEAPAILLLHGWGCDGTIFSFIESGLASQASLLIPDFPGHGKSGEPPQPWGVAEYAEQIRELLSQLNISKVHIVAHSFGGRVAIYLSSHYPQLIDRLVITGGAGIRRPVSHSQQKRQARYKRYQNLLKALGTLKPLTATVENLQDKLRRKYGSPDYNRLTPTMRGTFVKIVNQDLLPMLPEILAPTLLVWGSEDTETPLWMGQEMEKSIPDAGLVIFDGRTHFAFIEEWQRFLLILKEFFWGGRNA